PGCRLAKSSSLNPRFSESATANASPRASMVVVEAVGASPREQASWEIEQSKATSEEEAKVEARGVDASVGRTLFVARGCARGCAMSSQVVLIRGTCSRLIVA